MRTWFKERRNLGGWERRNDKRCGTKVGEGKAELRDEAQKKQIFKKQTVGFGFLWALLLFCFCASKGIKKCSSSGETSMSAGKTKPRSTTLALLPSAAPNHRASTLSCFKKSQPEKKKKLPSQLCQVELVLTHYIFNLII